MINEKYVTLRGGSKIKVQEVTVRRILDALPFLGELTGGKTATDKESDIKKTFAEHADKLLGEVCGLNGKDLLDLYPSDLEQIWQAFREVNSFFFGVAEKLGVAEQLGAVLRSLLDGVGSQLADSLKTDIQTALTTASAGLSVPPSTPKDSGATE